MIMKKAVLFTFVSILMLPAIIGIQLNAAAVTSLSGANVSNNHQTNSIISIAETIWVPDNYTKIQEAINAANPGDTIRVRAEIYYEHLTIDRPLTLLGDDRSTTIIDGNLTRSVINLTSTNDVQISGFTIQNAIHGINLTYSTNVTISGNIITKNIQFGIFLLYSSNNTIYDNIISDNGDRGIYLRNYCSNNIVSNNTISNHKEWGIYLYNYSSNNIVSNNTILYSNDRGIYLINANNNIFDGNTISNNTYGISIWDSVGNTLRNNKMTDNGYNFDISAGALGQYIQDIDATNTINGKPMYYWVNQADKQVPAGAGYVAAINSKNITVKDQTLTKNKQGVLFAYTTDSTIANVNASYNYIGIYLFESDNNSVNCNVITNSSDGVELAFSSGNALTDNDVTSKDYGIWLKNSSGNRVHHNRIADSGRIFNFSGELIPIGGGVFLSDYSSDNVVSDNMVSSNVDGIHLDYECNSNAISGNAISNNSVNGIYLYFSNNNTIYHNNFINNTNQVYIEISINTWDDGYPSGGNYWSNYMGVDEYSGVNQDEPGSDGIGDTPYVIDENNRDNYPLITSVIVLVDQIIISDDRCDVGSLQTVAIHAVWAHNNSNVVEGSLYVNGTQYITNSTGWISFNAAYDTVGKRVWTITGFVSFQIIWDRINITMLMSNNRIDVGKNATITWSGTYEYDGFTFSGSLTLNDTQTLYNAVGERGYTTLSVSDPIYGLTAFTSNIVYCIWDRVKIVEGGVSKKQTNVNQEETVWFKAVYEYDNVIFDGIKGTLYVNGSAMTWSSINNRWEHAYSFNTSGIRTFQVSEVSDSWYALTAINDAVGALSIIWIEAVPLWVQWWFWAAIGAAGIIVVFVLIYFLKMRKSVKRTGLGSSSTAITKARVILLPAYFCSRFS